MKQKNYYQLNSIILPIIMLIILGVGLFAATRLSGLRQILKSRAALEKATIELGASKTAAPQAEFEVPVMLSLKNQEIVAADVVLTFDKSALELKDITPKPDSPNNKLTTYLPKDNSGFNKNKVLQTANSTGRIEFGAVCFSSSGCPQGQNQDLKETNPLAILKFKTLKTGNTAVSILYSPNANNNSNLITRAKEQIIGNSTPLNITVASNVSPTTAPASAPADSLRATCSNNQLTLTWQAFPEVNRYLVRVDDTANGWDPPLQPGDFMNDNVRSTTYTNNNAQPGHTYGWWIHTVSDDGQFIKFNGKDGFRGPNVTCSSSVSTKPPAPTGLTASCPAPGTTANLSWNPVPGATVYALRVDNTTSGGWNITCNGSAGDFCSDNETGTAKSFNSTAGNSYTWWMHACNNNGCGDPARSNLTCSSNVSTPTPTSAPIVNSDTTSVSFVNSSFETWSSGAGSGTINRKAPDNWVMTPNNGYSRRDGNNHGGSYSWLRAAYTNGGAYMGGYQDVTVNPNTNYIFSVWVYEPKAPMNWYRSEAGGSIDVRNRICARTTSNQDIKCLDSTEASTTWQKLEVSFNSGSNATIRFYFGTNINQDTFWDDFSIRAQ